MASAYKKGNIFEGEVKKILESEGWQVEGQHRMIRYIPDFKHPNPVTKKPTLRMIMMGRDVYGVDLIAKKSGEKTHWIQVSTRENKTHKIKQVMIHPWNFDHDIVQLWLRSDGVRQYEIFQAPQFESVGIKRAI